MKLSAKSIEALRIVINGDGSEKVSSPYRQGWKIEAFFAEFRVELGQGSRWAQTEGALGVLNGTRKLEEVIKKVFLPIDYIEHSESIEQALDYINKYFSYDGYVVKISGNRPTIQRLDDKSVKLETDKLAELNNDNLMEWLTEHSQKCFYKIQNNDYSGAITNSRSMLEELFKWILNNTSDGYDLKFNGDLMGQAKEVMKRFDMDPKTVALPLKQMLSGMNSIIQGLSQLRNAASDSHGTNYRPQRRHALLAVNAAHAIANYFIELTVDKSLLDAQIAGGTLTQTDNYYVDMVSHNQIDQIRGG
ncbi:MAG: hypothetical protein JWO55_464 [Candidatus Saccharibacteria bacterium]|jgi:hypothetical protein|nr:hypothetical protein [Candidatus Saccharibacteria bacterium]